MPKRGGKGSRLPLLGALALALATVLALAWGFGRPPSGSGGSRPDRGPAAGMVTSGPCADPAGRLEIIDRQVQAALEEAGIPDAHWVIRCERTLKEVPSGRLIDYRIAVPDGQTRGRLRQALRQRLAVLAQSGAICPPEMIEKDDGLAILCGGQITHRLEWLPPPPGHGPARGDRPRLAIIIDDLGYDLEIAEAFIALDLPLTLSVLPFAPHTQSVAAKAAANGREVMLHLPMEPLGYPDIDPGPGSLLLEMPAAELRRRLELDLAQVIPARGVNNHMGSAFTLRAGPMETVLKCLKARGLFFVDSVTTGGTLGRDLAKRLQVPATRRDFFLDHDARPEAIRSRLVDLVALALKRGSAVGIGHPHRATLQVLREWDAVSRKPVDVVPVSVLTE